jgi:predicted ATP-dependent serine protease
MGGLDEELDEIFAPSRDATGPMSASEIESLVVRARAGDQNALACMQMINRASADNAVASGNARALGEFIRRNPASDSLAVGSRYVKSVGFLDAVCGSETEDGLPRSSVILLSGPPGAGKTTLALQALMGPVASGLGSPYLVTYVTDHSRSSLLATCERIHFDFSRLDIVAMRQGELNYIDDSRGLLVVDALTGTRQDVTTVNALTHAARRNDVPVIAIGNMTRDGDIRGPLTIQHAADLIVCLSLPEIDRRGVVRAEIECHKNRYGPAHRTRLVSMMPSGLVASTRA